MKRTFELKCDLNAQLKYRDGAIMLHFEVCDDDGPPVTPDEINEYAKVFLEKHLRFEWRELTQADAEYVA